MEISASSSPINSPQKKKVRSLANKPVSNSLRDTRQRNCICRTTNECDKDFIQCDTCPEYFEGKCFGYDLDSMTASEIKNIEFVCPMCLYKQTQFYK